MKDKLIALIKDYEKSLENLSQDDELQRLDPAEYHYRMGGNDQLYDTIVQLKKIIDS